MTISSSGTYPDNLAEVKAKKSQVYYECVRIATSTLYKVTNAPFPIQLELDEVDSGTGIQVLETYDAAGALLSIDELEENMNFEVPKITLQINGLKEFTNGEFFIETMLGLEYVDKPVRIYRVYFDNGRQVIGSLELFRGNIESAQLQYDPSGGCSVAIEVASHWSTFDKTNGRFTNKNSQQFYYPSDTGLNNCKDVFKEIVWKAS